MIDWQHLSFFVEQRDDSLNENIVVKSNTNGHVTASVVCPNFRFHLTYL